MKEHPILFSAPMVRALLAGTKQQTRRAITWQGPRGYPHFFDRAFPDNPAGVRRLCVPYHHPDDPDRGDDNPAERHYPRWEKGDALWVREAWKTAASLDKNNATEIAEMAEEAAFEAPWTPVEYSADGVRDNWSSVYAVGRQRLARFMPRWLSRITLEVTEEPTPQRLQDISENDAVSEGIDATDVRWGVAGGETFRNARNAYRSLWLEINGPGSWETNPWVWRVAFRVLP
jgi:hypothetical protein